MTANDDLSNAFGRPARNLSTLLDPNPRRARRNNADPESETGDEASARAESSDRAPAGSGPAAAPDPSGPDVDPNTTAPDDRNEEPTKATPSPAAPAAPGHPATEAAPAPAQRGSARSRRQTARSKASGTRSDPTTLDPDTSYQVGIYVHPYARTAAIKRRKTEKVTNAEIVFDAVDAVQHRLEGLVRERRHQARPESSLFPGRVRRGRLAGGGAATLEGDARRVLWQFRANGAELEVIDRLVAQSGAESRSELVAVALEATLLG